MRYYEIIRDRNSVIHQVFTLQEVILVSVSEREVCDYLTID